MGPDNLMGRCPFHDDQTPSFGVTPSKNLWNCLAGCGGGDVIELVMRKENVSFRQAVDILRQRLGILPEDPTIETRSGTTHPMLVPPSETELADHVLLGHVLDFYHQTFFDDLKAMRYLQTRHCFDAEAVKVFRIGYAKRTLCYRVPGTTAAGERLKEQLQRLGIIRERPRTPQRLGDRPDLSTNTATWPRCTPARSRGPCGRDAAAPVPARRASHCRIIPCCISIHFPVGYDNGCPCALHGCSKPGIRRC